MAPRAFAALRAASARRLLLAARRLLVERHVRERETLAMQSELDEAVSEHARLHAALQRKEEEHRVEVRCRSAASAELRQLRAELLEHRETVEKHQRTEDQLRMRVEVLTRELETRARMRDGPGGGT